MKAAIGYVRVSTQEQVVEGVSLDAQKAKIEAWAMLNNCELVGVVQDAGISGKRSDNRPGLQAALIEACERRAALVVYSLSRVSRSTQETLRMAEKLEKAGADLVSLSEQIDTTSAAGKMIFRILAVMAEFERDLISERTKTALAHKRMQGQKTGGYVPFGYDSVEGKLTKNAVEIEAVALIEELRKRGDTLRPICAELERRGIQTKRGRSWRPMQVSRILKRAA
jgi:site-specific DNA recombinase